MSQPFGEIRVEGLKEFQRASRKAADTELPKRLGQANKELGRKFIDTWLQPKPDPAAVGQGAGATVRPSASKREVLLRTGGKHRAGRTPQAQWGKRRGGDLRNAPARPYIRESVERHRDDIEREWLQGMKQAMDPAFHDVDI